MYNEPSRPFVDAHRDPCASAGGGSAGASGGLALRRRGSTVVMAPVATTAITINANPLSVSPTIYSTPRLSISPCLDSDSFAGSGDDERVSYFSTLPPDSPVDLELDGDADHFRPSSHDVYHGVDDPPVASYLPTPPSSVPGSARLGPAAVEYGNRERRYSATSQLSTEMPTTTTARTRTISAPLAGDHGGVEWTNQAPLVRTHSHHDASRPVLADERGRHVNLLSIDDSPAKLKKRPSLVLTLDPSTMSMNQGLGVDVDMSQPLPSPTGSMRSTRRAYPTEPSSLPSPLLPPTNTLSPASSPTVGLFPHLFSSNSNAGTLPSSVAPVSAPVTTDRTSSTSPQLGSLAKPLGRLATGLVRRASNANLNGDQLPMAQPRRASDSKAPSAAPSPKLGSLPSRSPTLGVTTVVSNPRRASYASQARDKEQEKRKELQAREQKKRVQMAHNRAFSWAVRPGDILLDDQSKSAKYAFTSTGRRKWILGLIVVLGLWWVVSAPSDGAADTRSWQGADAPQESATPEVARRARPDGNTFIHPDIISRRPSLKKKRGPLPWISRTLGFTSTHNYITRKAFPQLRTRLHPDGYDETKKHHNVFVAAPHVAYSEHKALPPPLEHSDAPERDTLVLYRILGNDLPPRHSPGQTLRNLRFLLQFESDFSALPPLGPHGHHHSHAYGSGSGSTTQPAHSEEGGLRVDKYFVLNRIADEEMVAAIVNLLHMYSVPNSRILIIPFEWEVYQRRDFRWDGGVDNARGWDIGDSNDEVPNPRYNQALFEEIAQLSESEDAAPEETKRIKERRLKREVLIKLRAIDFTYHEKNLYAMNNNGGRNFALLHGRSLPNARWILPLDGNSFLTPAAMYSIVQTLSIAGEGPSASRYLLMPMARLLSNDDVRENNTIKLVPRHHEHVGQTASEEAELLARPDGKPHSPEEPQIGFRYDSTETFQEAMRYGRRSKLELLWRLGAIPYSRGLDQRTLPWEATDRAHVTAKTWGSIPGAEGTNATSIIHRPIPDPMSDGSIQNPAGRGPPAFVQAGWVYRLFSGYKRQEESSSEAVMLRNTNRIKGIISFLERLDEHIARGDEGCDPEEDEADCGFHADRFWNFDEDHLDVLRALFDQEDDASVDTVQKFERLIAPAFVLVSQHLGSIQVEQMDAQTAAQHALMFALAGYLTSERTYSAVASQLILDRFVKQLPLYYRQNDQRKQQLQYSGLDGDDDTAFRLALSEHGSSYAFPPPPVEPGHTPTWNAELGRRVSAADIPKLPFDPLIFDPSMLLDAVRLLNHPDSPHVDDELAVTRKAMQPMLVAHLSWLLYSPAALEFSRRPPSATAGAAYDAKIATLAAFLDDAKLLGRVANRARLRLPKPDRAEGIMTVTEDVKDVHWRLIQGLAHIRFRPYSMMMDLEDLEHGGYQGSAHGYETPMDVLHVY